MITHKQITLAEVFEDCQNKFDNDVTVQRLTGLKKTDGVD